MFKKLIYKWFKQPITIVADKSPFRNDLEHFKFYGLLRARRFAKKWLSQHPFGQCYFFNGHDEIKVIKNEDSD
jgi:hypothetical protein